MSDTATDPLAILLSRAARGVLIPEEGDKLRRLVRDLQQQLQDADEDAAEAREHNDATCEAVARAEKAEAAVDRVRILCDLTIAASCRVQAVQQAHDTLVILNQQPTETAR